MGMTKTDFDLEKVYDDEIAPLMSKIIDICKANKLPMFATFLYAHDEDNEGGQFCTTALMFKDRPIPEEMLDLPDSLHLTVGRPAFRIRTIDKTGAVTKEEVVFP